MFHRFGCHRVVAPTGVLPQAADRLDTDFSRLYPGEILIDVELLNIDAASFVQMEEAHGATGVAAAILDTVRTRGKQHNPVTQSGGMLVGRIAGLGTPRPDLPVGTRIATLVSLSLTPLVIDEIIEVHHASHQIAIRGRAVIFGSGIFARIPPDLPLAVSLAVLDVCGAPARVARFFTRSVASSITVVVLGAGGKSGLLAAAAAQAIGTAPPLLLGIDASEPACESARALGAFGHVIALDARNALQVLDWVNATTHGKLADLTVVCTTVPECELGAILATRNGGTVLFFSMATNFQRATLGAEGVGKDVTLEMGNGYAAGHADLAFSLVRANPRLREVLERRFVLK
ncbi:MAG: L-erythro-3,5-diaminohexanoate dehydrogenase [Deltaproteobacteria bacterium]|nr:L-erythro-3,5-diaminohexanoate dehydrogenase [Deltaproteobacteria bacterium]